MDSNKKTLELLLSTLQLILVDFGTTEILEYKLEELEGDSYTFLHKDSVDLLLKNNNISEKEYRLILSIRQKIMCIQRDLWNPTDFLENVKWIDVRKETIEVLNLYSCK